MTGSSSLRQEGFEPGRFARTLACLRAGVAEGVAPGMVAGLWRAREPGVIRVEALGARRLYPRELPRLEMRADTVFDLASLTKIMATATLAARLVDRGWLGWDTPLRAILPQAACDGVEVGHLLSHTAGYAAWAPFWERLRERFAPMPLQHVGIPARRAAMRELACAARPEAAPGERAVYSDITFLLLGFALEEVTGLALERAVTRWVWEPMGLEGARYFDVDDDPVRARREEVAATEESAWRGGMLQGQVHDDNCWAMGGVGGHAGAFGAVRDVLQFARALYPSTGHRSFLSPSTLLAAWTRVAQPPGCSRTLGWDTPSGEEPAASRLFSPLSIGHLGYTGTSLWIDPEAGLAAALLTNRVHPTRENTLIRAFRPRFHEALRLDLR